MSRLPHALSRTCSMCMAVMRGRTSCMRCCGVCRWLNLRAGAGRANRSLHEKRNRGADLEPAGTRHCMSVGTHNAARQAPTEPALTNFPTHCLPTRPPAHNVGHPAIHAVAAQVKAHGLRAVEATVAPPTHGIHACRGGWVPGRTHVLRPCMEPKKCTLLPMPHGSSSCRARLCTCPCHSPQASQPTPWCTYPSPLASCLRFSSSR